MNINFTRATETAKTLPELSKKINERIFLEQDDADRPLSPLRVIDVKIVTTSNGYAAMIIFQTGGVITDSEKYPKA